MGGRQERLNTEQVVVCKCPSPPNLRTWLNHAQDPRLRGWWEQVAGTRLALSSAAHPHSP